MLFQPSNIYPSTFSGIGAGTVDVTQGLNVSWQVNGDTPMTAYQIKIYQNDSVSTLMYDSGSVTVSPAFEPHDKYGNATYFTAIISAAALSTAGIVNGYQYGYKMLITQWWGISDYVEQTSASVFITRSTPNISIDAIPNPVAASSITITATYSQAQGDPISTVEWVFSLAGSESNPIRKTGAISTQVLSFDADGLITGNTYSIMCNVVTSTGMEASTGFVQFPVLYSSSSLGINYQLAQLKNSSAVYLSWDDLGSNILSYPYTDTTKTTNGITFTVNGEGDVVATGTATADAYFTIAEGTTSQLGITAGQKFVITSGYSGAKIVVTETNGSNVVVATIEGSDPLQYIATSTTNTLKISIVIPSGSVLSSGQQLQPMIAIEDKIVSLNDVSVTMQPIQDLHGYSHPWPAGGGKNLYDASTFSTLTKNHVTCTNNGDGSFTLNGTASDDTYFNIFDQYKESVGGTPLPQGSYRLTGCPAGGSTETYYMYVTPSYTPDYGNGTTKDNTTVTGGSIFVKGGYTCDNLVFRPMIRISTNGDDTWQPYSNNCPISGRTGVVVTRTGKNLFDVAERVQNQTNAAGAPSSGYTLTNGVLSISKDLAYYGRVMLSAMQMMSGTYTLSFTVSKSGSGKIMYSVRNMNTKTDIVGATGSESASITRTFTVTSDTLVAISIQPEGSAVGTVSITDIRIELGSIVSTYEPYNGNTYAVDWTTEAGTVYHGTVDVVTGVLTVDRALVDMGERNYTKGNRNTDNTGYVFYFRDTSFKNHGELMSSQFKVVLNIPNWEALPVNCCNSASGSYIVFCADYSDAATFKTAMSGVQLVYELATPITYQLTAQEVAVLTGTNNVWSTGDSVSVTYTKDTGSQATLSGAIVTFSDSNAVLIPTPQYIPGITGISIYRYLQGELALQHVYDLATGATSILDYFAPSQTKVSYLLVAHSSVGDLFLQTNDFVPTFWFYSVLLCDTDSNGNYHVSREYIFKYGVETGAVSNNNDPTIQKNFTPYPNRQPISTLYKTGKVSGYIGKTNKLNQYSDTISLQNAIYDISVSPLEKFLKTRKGDVIKVDTASSIQMKTEDNTTQQALIATIDWAEVGDASKVSIVSVPADSFWPM